MLKVIYTNNKHKYIHPSARPSLGPGRSSFTPGVQPGVQGSHPGFWGQIYQMKPWQWRISTSSSMLPASTASGVEGIRDMDHLQMFPVHPHHPFGSTRSVQGLPPPSDPTHHLCLCCIYSLNQPSTWEGGGHAMVPIAQLNKTITRHQKKQTICAIWEVVADVIRCYGWEQHQTLLFKLLLHACESRLTAAGHWTELNTSQCFMLT